MDATVAAVVSFAQPQQVVRRLDPGADVVRVRDAGIVFLKPGKVDAVLQAELNVSVM